ncbi:MAG: HD domain-containing protein [Candidatus Microthrix sp.]|uniref:HD domain-containing protein n=1 Tax=Candidatus Neomicrothrix sp. TaxID=2719034 RepID=UPI0025BE4968|nr:HD domain-containing protein [Candidatus Microthrix sp.]MBL0204445.1 HD domain-containing protein [Candidatus Microthrix sp.]
MIDDLWPELTGHRRRVPADDVVLRDDPDLIAEVVRSGDRVLLLEQAQCSDLTSVLRLGVVAAERGLRLRRDTLVGLVDLAPIPEPWSTQARRLFCRLVASGPSSVRVVEALDRVGLWARILPEWEAVRCAPQRNPYHRFTVDRHLLECAAIAAGLSGRVDRPDLLVLGALFHDLGKGRPGDHSEVGAQLARGAMERMGFPKRETDGVVAMVTHHLLMPEVATRRDLDDPATIAMVTDQVGSVGEVRMLAALAEADGRATGSTAWGPWKASLVRTLADRTIARLAGIEAIEDASQGTLSDDPEVKGLLETCAPVLRGEGDRLVVYARPARSVCPCRRCTGAPQRADPDSVGFVFRGLGGADVPYSHTVGGGTSVGADSGRPERGARRASGDPGTVGRALAVRTPPRLARHDGATDGSFRRGHGRDRDRGGGRRPHRAGVLVGIGLDRIGLHHREGHPHHAWPQCRRHLLNHRHGRCPGGGPGSPACAASGPGRRRRPLSGCH